MKFKRKKTISIIVFFIIILIIFLTLIIKNTLNKQILVANSQEKSILKAYKKAQIEEFNIDNIIEENSSKIITQEIVVEQIDLEYTTIYKNNNELPKGQLKVLQEGRDGKQSVVNKKTYQNDELIKEEQTGRIVTKAALDKIVEIGTGSKTSIYKVKKGDIVYVTSYTLDLMQEKNKDSNKITTLSKDNQVKVLEVTDEWYKISYKSYVGWADANCLIYKEKQIEQSELDQGKTKEQLLTDLNKNMNLNKPSGLTLEQFKKVLSNNKNDKNKIFEQNANYFYYIEKQYNINGLFVAAVGIHESNWGTSKIALSKKNLFGYGASDSNPYENAYKFGNYSEAIDMIARVFVKYYINPSGTKIYDNEIATGKYYSGPKITDVNKKYATDKNWHNGVYKWMTYLYNRL